jgi:hypothetical protein
MTFQEAVAELRARYKKAGLSPSVVRGECFSRAGRIDFQKGRGWTYAGKDADGTEVVVSYNDTEKTICCTEVGRCDRPDAVPCHLAVLLHAGRGRARLGSVSAVPLGP